MTTVAAQWHTPNPPAPVVSAPPQQQPNISVGLLERLLHRYGNPRSTELGRADDLTLYQTYSAVFGAPQGPQNSYKMMAALATPNDIKAWLEEWKYRVPAALPNVSGLSAVHTALDERLPNGIIRHRHHTAVGANRGPPRRNPISGLIDPYLGTGLDPSHLSGVVTAPEGAPYMACCGQELGPDGEIPPGCWIGQRNPQGNAIPYQVWFQRMDGDAIWQAIAAGNATAVFTAATQVGTAFLDRAYYADLDRQIRALVIAVVPGVVQVQLALLQSGFSAAARIVSAQVREQLETLVGLVETYNAPQMGAKCAISALVNNDFLDSHIFHFTYGRTAFLAGRLQSEINVNGVPVPRLLDMNQLGSVVTRLTPYERRLPKNMVAYLSDLNTFYTNWQNKWKAKSVNFVDICKEIATRLTNLGISVPVGFINAQAIILSYIQLTDKILSDIPTTYNGALLSGQNIAEAIETSYTGLERESEKLEVAFKSQEVPSSIEATAFLKALTLPTQDAIDRWIASGPPLEDAGALRSVQNYAQFFLAHDGMVKAFPYVKNELDASLDMLKRRAIEDAERLRQGAIRPPPPSVVVETPPSPRGRQNELIVRLDLKDRDPTPVRLNEWDIKQTFEYADQSCTYDSLFASMFAIPNQWLRNQILKKEIVNRFPWCEENAVKAIDNTVVATIAYFERRLARVRFDAVCPNRNIWKECLPRGTAPGVQEEGNPLMLLDSLIRFYELQDAWLIYTQTYNDPNWNPQAGPSVIPDTVELYAVTAESTAWKLSQPYNVPVVRGDFTILSCIIHTGGHWQACVRHPGTGVWWRMLDSGVPQELGPNPAEIREATYTDPARQNTDGRYGTAPGARYEPMIWFYVRTKALADFTMKPGASSVRRSSRKMGQTPSSPSQLSVRDFLDPNPNDPLIQLFGAYTRRGRTRVFYEDSDAYDADVIIGAAQLLQHLDDENVVQIMIQKYRAKSAVVAFPGWKTGDAGFDYVAGVNEFIHPLLVDIFTRKKIGDRITIPKDIHMWFREEAKVVYLGIYDENSDSYFVPKWSRVRDVKRHVWPFAASANEIFPILGKAWGNLLILLLMALVGELKPTDETFLKAQTQHEEFKGYFYVRLDFMAKQITLADALRWESRDDEVKYITSQLPHLDESDELHDLRLQQLHDRIAVLEGRPTRSLHHMFFEEKKE